jgi:hypothetical protein
MFRCWPPNNFRMKDVGVMLSPAQITNPTE